MTPLGLTGKAKLFASFLILMACIRSIDAAAASDCGIGLKESTTIPTVDGQEGAEWADASVMDSTSPCFQKLKDLLPVSPPSYLDRIVTVKSKRYKRGTTWYLGFLFEVKDGTRVGPCADGRLCIGEKIIMQFNRLINGDAKLTAGEDKRFTLTHKWAGTGTSVTDGVIQVDPPVTDASCPAVSGVDVQWGPSGPNGINLGIRSDVIGGGYRAEIEVPVAFVTGATVDVDLPGDIGVTFAVVNDFGKNLFGAPPDFNCSAAGTCEGAGASFPTSLPETNDANAVDAPCDKGWVVPKEWGVGYRNSPPAQVTISRGPHYYWDSDGIQAFECDTPGYTYYPVNPCKVRIRADLRNSGATTRRKIVFLWAKHGTGDPLEYNFVGLRDVVVDPGTPATPVLTHVLSDLWSGVPKNSNDHPCLRVYIFPDSLSTADQDTLRGNASGVVTKANLDNVVAANAVADQHWAQKNISRHSTATDCPNMACEIIGSRSPMRLDFDPIRIATASDTPIVAGPNWEGGGALPVPGKGTGVLLSSADWERYAKDHVIVQARTVAYRVPSGGRKPLYSFIEDFGGVVQLFPVEMVQERRELPLEFEVSNASTSTMRVKVLADIHVPASVSGVSVTMDQQELTLQPQSSVTVKGTVTPESTPPMIKWWMILIILLIILLLFILWYRRRHSTP